MNPIFNSQIDEKCSFKITKDCHIVPVDSKISVVESFLSTIQKHERSLKDKENRIKNQKKYQEYEKKRYTRDREKRLLKNRVCCFKSQLKKLGLEVPKVIKEEDLPPPSLSNYEYLVKISLEKNFPNYKFLHVRPSYIRNKEGNRLELDHFCEELKLAIETNGEQHYWPVKKFDRTEDKASFYKRLEHDRIKAERCKELGITLFIFRFDDYIEDLLEKVKKYIDEFEK